MQGRLLAVVGILALFAVLGAPAAAEDTGRALPSGGTVGLELVAEGLTSPVWLGEAGDGSGRLFVADQAGLVRIIRADGTLLGEPFLDVRDRMVPLSPFFDERGLLGFAFHPEFADNGRVFVYYSAPLRTDGPEGWNHTSHLSEFTVSDADPDRIDLDSERLLLQVDQPQFNHNAGDLAFGPDGFLYVALGDGGGANDVGLGHTPDLGNGQDVTNLLGSILRIDVDAEEPYGIPADNPLVGSEGRDEIFAYGFRNPWRLTFDPSGELGLLAADAGQNLWEEVSMVERGGNFGWNIKEGTHCFDPDDPFTSPPECPDTGPLLGDPLIDPVIEYANIGHPEVDGIGLVVVGGRVYRGDALPRLRGRYVFADWSADFGEPDGTLLVAKPRTQQLWKLEELRVAGRPGGRLGHFVLGFGQDAAGEVYVLTTDRSGPTGQTGRVYRLATPRSGEPTATLVDPVS